MTRVYNFSAGPAVTSSKELKIEKSKDKEDELERDLSPYLAGRRIGMGAEGRLDPGPAHPFRHR